MGDFPAAKQFYQRALQTNAAFETDWRSVGMIGLGHILMKEGKLKDAQRLLDLTLSARMKTVDAGNEDNDMYYSIAAIYAIRDEKPEANTWLQKAIELGWRDYRPALRDPWFENLRSDSQFQKVMAQVKTKVDELRERVRQAETE
jgi:tetratricopeptide (TPR) repeat protein